MLLFALLLCGCFHRPFPPSNLRQLHSIHFRNCKITDYRDGKNVCESGRIEWIRDVQEARWIGVCLK